MVSRGERFSSMVHAQLFRARKIRSAGLASEKARVLAEARGLDLFLCGAPGIGCPVIASLSQTDLAVVVTEPTPSELHDLERVASLCDHFGPRSRWWSTKSTISIPSIPVELVRSARKRLYAGRLAAATRR